MARAHRRPLAVTVTATGPEPGLAATQLLECERDLPGESAAAHTQGPAISAPSRVPSALQSLPVSRSLEREDRPSAMNHRHKIIVLSAHAG